MYETYLDEEPGRAVSCAGAQAGVLAPGCGATRPVTPPPILAQLPLALASERGTCLCYPETLVYQASSSHARHQEACSDASLDESKSCQTSQYSRAKTPVAIPPRAIHRHAHQH